MEIIGGSWISYLFSMVAGLLIATSIWGYAKAVVDMKGTLTVWAARALGILGLVAALWFAERPQVVGIIVLFFGASVLALGTAWLARKMRMR